MDLFDAAKSVSITRIALDIHGLDIKHEGGRLVAVCPFHADRNPSLVFDERKNVFKCFGCDAAGSGIDYVMRAGKAGTPEDAAAWIVNRYGLGMPDSNEKKQKTKQTAPENRKNVKENSKNVSSDKLPPFTLKDYSEKKCLPVDYLQSLGMVSRNGWVHIPYRLEDGKTGPVRFRHWQTFKWKKGSKLCLYGLDRLSGYSDERVILVEGESDSQTLWFHKYPCLGVPGARNFQEQWTEYLMRFQRVYLHKEPDEAGQFFVKKIAYFLLKTGYKGEILVFSIPDCKDPNELHRAVPDDEPFCQAFDAALAAAHPPTPEELADENEASAPGALRTIEDILARVREMPDEVFSAEVIGALAMMPVADQARVKAVLKSKGISGRDIDRAIQDTRKEMRKRLRIVQQGEQPERPSLAEILEGCPLDAPVPAGWNVNEQGVWETVTRQGEYGQSTSIERRFPVPVVLASVLRPLDTAEESYSYEITWLNGAWHHNAFPAEVLFDRSRLILTAGVGLPVDSENSKGLLRWLAALRDTRLIPEKKVVTRCGWYGNSNRLFVLGRSILEPGGGHEIAAVGSVDAVDEGVDKIGVDTDGCQPNVNQNNLNTGKNAAFEVDKTIDINQVDKVDKVDMSTSGVDWTPSVKGTEKELIGAIGVKGDPDAQLEIVKNVITKYPLAGFLIGASAAAPLLRLLHANGRLEIHGFIVEVTSDQAGVGKSTGNELAASIWGNPGGLARTFNRTSVAWEVLLHTMCDMPVFLEETQLASKEDMATQLVYALALGMGRERGNRSGGMRVTRQFWNTVLLASEKSLKTFAAREGIEARVISLPPVFGRRTPEKGKEIRELRTRYFSHYGHLGRRYIQYLADEITAGRWEDILLFYDVLIGFLEQRIPAMSDGEMVATAMRMATRVATCWLGLQLLLQAQGFDQEEAYGLSFPAAFQAWDYVIADLDTAPLWKRALAVIQSWAAENVHRIAGMEMTGGMYGDAKIPPGGYIGGVVTTLINDEECLAFYPNAFDEALKKHLGIEGKTIRQGLVREGVIIPDAEGTHTRAATIKPASQRPIRTRFYCIPKKLIFLEE